MDELMKQAEDHLAKGRVQIATDEAIHGIKHVAFDESDFESQSLLWEHIQKWEQADAGEDAGAEAHALENHIKFLIGKYIDRAALSSNAAQSAGQEHKPVGYVHLAPCSLGDNYDVRFWEPVPIGTKLYTHPSSAAQVEEIRNAAYQDAAAICRSYEESMQGHDMAVVAAGILKDRILEKVKR